MKPHRTPIRLAAYALALAATLSTSAAHAVLLMHADGEITDSDLQQSERLFRDGVASTWGSAKPFPGTLNSDGPYHYDVYNVAFAPNATQDVFYEIEYFDWYTYSPHAVAYLGAFDPNDIALGYLGDSGITPYVSDVGTATFQVMVPAGGALVLNFHQTDGRRNPAPYTFEVRAFSDANYGESFGGNGVPAPATLPLAVLALGGLGLARGRRTR